MRISDWSSDVCSSDLLVVVIFGGGVALVIGEADCPLADIEHELAISAVVILPAAVQVAERVVRQLLDRAFERLAAALEIVLVIARNRDPDIDLGQRDLTAGVARLNALDRSDEGRVGKAGVSKGI